MQRNSILTALLCLTVFLSSAQSKKGGFFDKLNNTLEKTKTTLDEVNKKVGTKKSPSKNEPAKSPPSGQTSKNSKPNEVQPIPTIEMDYLGSSSIIHPLQPNSTGAAGTVDLGFGRPEKNPDIGVFLEGFPYEDAVIQKDGKIVLAGLFRTSQDFSGFGLVRFNSDWSIDKSFVVASGFDKAPRSVGLQSDGKIIVVGDFSTYNGHPAPKIVRVNSDGSLDKTFQPGKGFTQNVRKVVIEPDDRILVMNSSQAPSFDGVAQTAVTRLTRNGTLDPAFDAVKHISGTPLNMLRQADGKIVITGLVYAKNNQQSGGSIIRLNADGSVDNSFRLSGVTFGTNHIEFLDAQKDGKLIVGIIAMRSASTKPDQIVRLNHDGAFDPTFDLYNTQEQRIESIKVLPDQRILISGTFRNKENTRVEALTCLLPDGSRDPAFTALALDGYTRYLDKAKILPNGLIMLPVHKMLNGVLRNGMAVIQPGGTITEIGSWSKWFSSKVTSITCLPDQKVLVTGTFTHYFGIPCGGMIKLQKNGSIDPSFKSTQNNILTAAVQPDGKLIIVDVHGVVKRLEPNGELDPTFQSGKGIGMSPLDNYHYLQIRVLSSGKILLSGNFTSYDQTPINGLVRIAPDGVLDHTFKSAMKPGLGKIVDIAELKDGKLLVAGAIDIAGLHPCTPIVRLMPDGKVDPSFKEGISSYPSKGCRASSIEVLPDGKIMIGGDNMLARLNPNGSADAAFKQDSQIARVEHITLHPDGSILAEIWRQGSSSTLVYCGLQKFRQNGQLEEAFYRPKEVTLNQKDDPNYRSVGRQAYNNHSGWITTVAAQSDGQILIGGEFESYDGYDTQHIARLHYKNGKSSPSSQK